jgi:hypothetical protein
MLKQTTQLFIKAVIIGLLVNLILQQFPVTTASPVKKAGHSENRYFIEQPGPVTSSQLFDQFKK